MQEWKLMTRSNKIFESPQVTIRMKGISLNAALAKAIEENERYCEFYSKGRQIGLKFTPYKTPDSYTIGRDGGGRPKKGNTFFIACIKLIKNSPALLNAQKKKQSFLCSYDKDNALWVFNLIPAFESEDISALKEDDIGVYRYILQGEEVYIGHGKIKSRISDSVRSDWSYEKVEYFICDKSEAIEYEKVYLDEYVKNNGRLPFYNKVNGMKKQC